MDEKNSNALDDRQKTGRDTAVKHNVFADKERDRNEEYGAIDLMDYAIKIHCAKPEHNALLKNGCKLLMLNPMHRRVLAEIGFRNECCITDIADYTGITLTTASRICIDLANEGYIERFENKENRRFMMVRVAEKGIKVGEQYYMMFKEFTGKYYNAYLTKEEQEELRVSILKVVDIMQKLDPSFSDTFKFEKDYSVDCDKFEE